ncbi:MAG: hypothetical protein ACI9PY_000049 [Ascidiaceihabitans sp.]|jgi:hypothetical protein
MEEIWAPMLANPLMVKIIIATVIPWLAVIVIACVVGFRFPSILGFVVGFGVLVVCMFGITLWALQEFGSLDIMPLWFLVVSTVLSPLSLVYLVLVGLIVALRRGPRGERV